MFVAVDDGGERVCQPSVGVDAVHLAGRDEGGHDGPVLSPGVVSCKEDILSVQGDGADGAFDGVVDLHTTTGQEAAKAVAVFGDVGQRLAQW